MKSEWKEYCKLEIPGKMLVPGFSIYLLQVNCNNDIYFYIGMTGDPFFPSARAAFHRISGHLELAERSTQNQLMEALKTKGVKEENFNDLKITMHHFPINGFEKWTLTKGLDAKEINKQKDTPVYEKYNKRQKEVQNFEDILIHNLRQKIGNRLLNKTKGKIGIIAEEFNQLAIDIDSIISTNLLKIKTNE